MFDPWVGNIPWRRERLPLQYSGLENSMGCIVYGVSELDMTEDLSLHFKVIDLKLENVVLTKDCLIILERGLALKMLR